MSEQPGPDNTLLIGTLIGPFGIRGQVKLRATTSNIDHLIDKIRSVYLGPKYLPHRISRAFEHKPGQVVLSFEGITTREAAEELRNTDVWILAKDAPPLAEDEYFLHDLPGLRVETESGEFIGTVRDYLETGASEVIIVAREGAPEALIPLVRDLVAELNVAAGRIVIRPIPGLLDNAER